MKKASLLLCLLLCLSALSACGGEDGGNTGGLTSAYESGDSVSTDISTDEMDFSFTDSDTDCGYDESSAKILGEDEKDIKITATGTYVITGSRTSVTVSAPETAKIQIVLKGADISNPDGPAIYITEADKVFLTAYKDTENSVSDGDEYSDEYSGINADAAIFSKADLTVNGEGTLFVTGEYKCGIVSKDDLVICGLILTVKSVGRAIEGKDCVKILSADITADAGGDGIKSTNEEDSARGYVYIESGSLDITAANDGIQAQTVLKIQDGGFDITTGGGSSNASSDPSGGWGMWGSPQSDENGESAKALKATSLILISGGEFKIDSSDDSVHSNGDIQIDGGDFSLSSGDDGIHADDQLLINGGNIVISESYEGLEATAVIISGGTADITSSDDGINAAGGSDSSSLGGRPGENSFSGSSDITISITGGYITVNASGDGIDSNGTVTMSGGVLLVSGPTDNGNGALDYQTSAVISGGTAILCGSSGMAQSFSQDSSQPSFMYTLDSAAGAGDSIAVSDASGRVIASFMPSKQYNNIVISSPEFSVGDSYTVTVGGTVSGCDANGFTQNGGVSGGETEFAVELTSAATVYGQSGGMGGGMNGGTGGIPGGGRPSGGRQSVGR